MPVEWQCESCGLSAKVGDFLDYSQPPNRRDSLFLMCKECGTRHLLRFAPRTGTACQFLSHSGPAFCNVVPKSLADAKEKEATTKPNRQQREWWSSRSGQVGVSLFLMPVGMLCMGVLYAIEGICVGVASLLPPVPSSDVAQWEEVEENPVIIANPNESLLSGLTCSFCRFVGSITSEIRPNSDASLRAVCPNCLEVSLWRVRQEEFCILKNRRKFVFKMPPMIGATNRDIFRPASNP